MKDETTCNNGTSDNLSKKNIVIFTITAISVMVLAVLISFKIMGVFEYRENITKNTLMIPHIELYQELISVGYSAQLSVDDTDTPRKAEDISISTLIQDGWLKQHSFAFDISVLEGKPALILVKNPIITPAFCQFIEASGNLFKTEACGDGEIIYFFD